jgi:AcrR family transcriptional regulator
MREGREVKEGRVAREAVRLFAARGFDGVSVGDIAEACDMTQANLYRYASSKQDLARDLFVAGYARFGERLADAAAGAGRAGEKLEALVRETCRLHDEDRDMFRFLLIAQHNFLPDIVRDGRNPVEIIVRLLRAGMARGAFARAEAELVALAVVGIVVQAANGCLYGRLAGGLVERADALAAMARAIAGEGARAHV